MASISKSKRICDRISNLPDNLITHILSFLSTEDAVKTSVLSTSWNQQWTLLPLIRFGDYSPLLIRCSQSRVNFVYRVLLYKMTPLDLFQLLSVGVCYDAINVSNWISVALTRHVREIDVSANMPRQCCLPDSLYTSKTLVILKLKGNFVFQVPEKISLESLIIFHYNVLAAFEGGESFSRLVSSCPVLEELEITGKLKENVKVVIMSSRVLKRLILRDLYSIRVPEFGVPHAYELVLNTPNLQYLEHNDRYGVPDGFHICTLHCLDTARLNLFLDLYDLEEYDIEPLIPARSLVELLVAISSVRVLYVLDSAFEVLYGDVLPNFQPPKFHRLISLELGHIESNSGLRLLMAFLQSSPQLESLYFYLDCCDETWYPPTNVPFCMLYNLKLDVYETTWNTPTDVPFCMINSLKVIKADSYNELELLLNVLTYFLEKTNCLEKLIIPLDPEEKDEEFIEKVYMLPRASNLCEIVFT